MRILPLALAGLMAAGTASATALSQNQHASPYLRDGQFDHFIFGADADEVRIVDMASNSEVFRASGGGIKWDCRSSAGSLVPSGVYLARIKDKSGQLHHQALVVVR